MPDPGAVGSLPSGTDGAPAVFTPVFIGGVPRSGTTLLASLLGGSPECVAVPESQFKEELLRLAAIRPAWAKGEAWKLFASNWRFPLWGLGAEPPPAPCWSAASLPSFLAALAHAYASRKGKNLARLWVDHTPDNLRNAHALHAQFPEARFIHIVRDPRAVASSVLPLDWGPNTPMKAAQAWVEGLAHGLGVELSFSASRAKRVRYEDLVDDPVGTCEDIASWLEISFTPAMLTGEGYKPSPYSAGQHRMVGGKPDPARAVGWRSMLTPRDIEVIEYICGDLMLSMGYTPEFRVRDPEGLSSGELLRTYAIEMQRVFIINKWRLRRRKKLLRHDGA